MINKISGAKRLTGFDKPTVWSIMTPLAIKTKSVNLVFYMKHRAKASPHGHLLIFISKIWRKPKNNVILNSFSQSSVSEGIWVNPPRSINCQLP
jgi:hypothetical protein